MFKHAFGKRVKSMRMAGTAVVNAAQFRMIPEEKVYFYNVFYINEVAGLFTVTVAVNAFKQLNLAFGFPLVVHLEDHGGHFAFVVFLRSVNVKVTQTNNLAAGFAKITAGIVIKEQFGKCINIQRFLAFRFFGKAVRTAAVGRSGRSVNHLNFPVCCKMHQVFGIFKVVLHHVFAVIFHSIAACALVENNVNFFMAEFACFQCFGKINFIHIIQSL